jgi:hypothetical protein
VEFIPLFDQVFEIVFQGLVLKGFQMNKGAAKSLGIIAVSFTLPDDLAVDFEILGDVFQLDVGFKFPAQGEIIQFFGGGKKPIGADVVGGEFLLFVPLGM